MRPSPARLCQAALVLVIAWPFLFYWRATIGAGMFYFGDIARFFYPTRVLYAQALAAGRLPLWTPEILLGFPLFAEMQTGALYPVHLFLYGLFPVELALNYDILIHLALLAAGTFLFARGLGTSAAGATIAALAFSAGGFGVGRVTHMSVISVAAWLPWALWCYDRWRAAPRLRWWLALVAIWALQFLAGHPQFMLLNALTFAAFVFASAFFLEHGTSARDRRGFVRAVWRTAIPALALVLGAGIAAVQLLPTAELAQASARSGGVTEAFFTEFSYNPLFLAFLFDPFILGNPYPTVSVEVITYFGALPLLLAALAVGLRRRERVTWFWVILSLGCFLLALGGFDPLYRYLRYLPLLNFFRVPARFLFPLSLAVAMLAGNGLDVLRMRLPEQGVSQKTVPFLLALLLALVVIIALAPTIAVDNWVLAWRILPFVFWGSALALVVVALKRRVSRATLVLFAVGLALLDLAAFGSVYAVTYNVIVPQSEVAPRPRVLDSLSLADGARIRTSEWMYPWVAEMQQSLYPNLNATYGVPSIHGYTPLVPRSTQNYLDSMSPAMFNLAGGRYYLIPQALPVDPTSEAADLNDPFMIHPVGQTYHFIPTPATGIQVESSLAQSADLHNGDVVADIHLGTDDGRTLTAPLRAGFDTAEWAYERPDVRQAIKHSMPPVASSFPARSAFPVTAHIGHTYMASLSFSAEPVNITSISVEPKIPAGLLYIQKLSLTEGDSQADIAPLVGTSSHRLIYRSEDVAVFENPDYAPRAFITHNAIRVASDREALAALQSPNYSGALLLADGPPTESDAGQMQDETVEVQTYDPEYVVLRVHASDSGYLVLGDAWDPGWTALVDGRPAVIHRADVIFRAVEIAPGDHVVEFSYRPLTFYAGLIASAASLVLAGLIAALVRLRHSRRRESEEAPEG